MSPFVIKICGVTSTDDIRSVVEAGATAIGFNFYPPSPRFVTPSQARVLAADVPPDVAKVGVFVSPTPDELRDSIAAGGLDVVQIHGAVPSTIPSGVHLWRAVQASEDFRTTAADMRVEAYLIDTPSDGKPGSLPGGSGRTFDWNLATRESPARVILAGGLEASNVATAIHAARPWGVDACSRLESAPGKKDPEKVKAFVEAARAAFLQMIPSVQGAFMKETV